MVKETQQVAKTEQKPPDEAIPVSLLTGFLGSGKTTVLNHLLRQPEMGHTAVIVNEFGEIGLDHELVVGGKEDMVLLNSGCLCCTVRGDLVESLKRLYKKVQTTRVTAGGRPIPPPPWGLLFRLLLASFCSRLHPRTLRPV